MPDYTASNSHKSRDKKERPPKKIEPVVTSKVVIQKKGIGRKFKDLFVEADLRSVTQYVVSEVLLPAFRNMIVDSTSKGVERMMYGEKARRYPFGQQSRVTYQSPVQRSITTIPSARNYPADPRTPRYVRDDIIIASKEEAEEVLEQMAEILDVYEVVSVADLNELVSIPSSHVDNKWGWSDLSRARVVSVREGWLLEFPTTEPIA